MGTVAVTFRVMPEGLEIDIDDLKDRVRKALGASFRSMEEAPVAFGLKAIFAVALIDDASGGSEQLEQELAAVRGVGSVETIDATLI